MKFWKAAQRWSSPAALLVFAVCSLEREEGEEQIAAFLAAHPEFARVPMTADEVFGHGEWITPDGDLAHPALSSRGQRRDGRLLCGAAEKVLTAGATVTVSTTWIPVRPLA